MTNFKHSPLAYTLDNTISIYVPTVYGDHKEIDNKKLQKEKDYVTERFTSFFGGATETIGVGYFKHRNGIVQEEKVFIITSFSDDDSLNRNTLKLRTLASILAYELKQESVLLVVNGIAALYNDSENERNCIVKH